MFWIGYVSPCQKVIVVETPCVCISLPKDQQEQNIDPQPNIIVSYIDINEECNKLKKVF